MTHDLFAFNVFPVTAVFRLSSGTLLKVLFSSLRAIQAIFIPEATQQMASKSAWNEIM